MTIPTTTTYTINRDQIITYALRKIGALELGVSADATTIAAYTDPLNMLLKNLIVKGIKLWTLEELTLPLVSGQASYIIGNSGTTERGTPNLVSYKPQKLMQAWLRNVSVTPQNDIPLNVISQHNYNEFGSKGSTGTPNSVYMDVGREQATIKMYTTPGAIEATLYQLHLLTQRQIFDINTSTDNFDFPSEWLLPLGWAFAAEIAVDFEVPLEKIAYFEAKAGKLMSEVEDYDTEYNSVFLTPDNRWRTR